MPTFLVGKIVGHGPLPVEEANPGDAPIRRGEELPPNVDSIIARCCIYSGFTAEALLMEHLFTSNRGVLCDRTAVLAVFLQKILSERRSSAAGILGFRGITERKNSGIVFTAGNFLSID
jgi:hypothetical protein